MAAQDPAPDTAGDLQHLPARDIAVAQRLRSAPLEVVGRFLDASNATLLVRLTDRDRRPLEAIAEELGREPDLDDLDPADLAVYKPERGETPLWDFPAGTLHRREVAAYEVAMALGWPLVPVTVLRDDGPLGSGSLQRFVPHDPEHHFFWLVERADPAVQDQLTTMVVFDLVINNADRKGGHVLLDSSGPQLPPAPEPSTGGPRLVLVDHGVSFHVEPKLRTVAWHLAGDPVPENRRTEVAAVAEGFEDGLGRRLNALLADDEVAALADRLRRVADLAVFPEPQGPRATPWPLL